MDLAIRHFKQQCLVRQLPVNFFVSFFINNFLYTTAAIKSIPAFKQSTTFEIKSIVTKWLSKAPERFTNAEKKQERRRRQC